ncbi:MAG TPA: tryptophan--tRNA ligase [Pyrinomonadaceae bacterium]|jgi:tryptophanyl-tRNA synthetase|nr:tryptophan--tRNA ligase [Pyrinomonadaceae bacterium]
MTKRIFSGAQPTGNLHLGNYLGALKNWVALQHEYESFFCIVNLHALTIPQDPKLLLEKTRDLARIYLAVGIDPQVSTIFVQSDVPEHAELTWVLNCVARVPELERMTQYKEKAKKQQENVLVGLLDYPVLMASDILLYQTDLVPVGNDQKQHLELTRDIAIRFNRDYGETFKVPNPYIPKVGARIMSLSDPLKKMSKSDDDPNSRVLLMDDADTVVKKFKRAVTDSGTEIRFDESRPAINNLLEIYHLATGKSQAEVEDHFAGKGYAQLKGELADVIIEFLRPFQQRVSEITDETLNHLLDQGREKASKIASATLTQVYQRMGISGK